MKKSIISILVFSLIITISGVCEAKSKLEFIETVTIQEGGFTREAILQSVVDSAYYEKTNGLKAVVSNNKADVHRTPVSLRNFMAKNK